MALIQSARRFISHPSGILLENGQGFGRTGGHLRILTDWRLGGRSSRFLGYKSFDLFQQGRDDFVFGDTPDGLSLSVDHAISATGGNTEVGFAGFAGSVDRASHHRQTERRLDMR